MKGSEIKRRGDFRSKIGPDVLGGYNKIWKESNCGLNKVMFMKT